MDKFNRSWFITRININALFKKYTAAGEQEKELNIGSSESEYALPGIILISRETLAEKELILI